MAKRRTPESEHERLSAMREYERRYAAVGLIGGVDEAGRGPLAGPVVAACVILPPDCDIFYLDDSKKVTERRRELLYDEICEKAVSYGIGMVGPEVIDEINILQATYQAMREAIAQMNPAPELLLNDAVTIPGVDIPQVPLIHGDALSVSIAAASILAKVTRDRYMRAADSIYPEYGFAGHKGYGTKAHSEAILTYGLCPLHRRTFLRKLLGENDA